MNRAGTGIPATHHLDEAGKLCDRIVIIDNGRLVAVMRDGLGIVDVVTKEADLEDVFLSFLRAG